MPAVERAFDYLVPEAMAAVTAPGVIVRVGLGGRRVRGWVIADGVDSEVPPERLRPLAQVVSAGPPPEVVDLTAWVAWRFAGPRLAVLRAASPPAVVPPGVVGPPFATPAPAPGVAVRRWPPATPVDALVADLLRPATGSALVIVPDGRAGALASGLARGGHAVLPWRTDGRDSDRARIWARAAAGGGCVVVGGRSAVLAPVPDLSLVVVLDEGSESLKEERAPRWHAREVALERARRAGAPVVLVSPAPSLEALAAGPLLRPSREDERAGWAVLETVDRRREPPGSGLFSPRFAAAAHAALDAGGRVVCVLNRKGRARLLACGACRELARCERCGAALAESPEGPATLACRVCAHQRPRVCARCGSTSLRALRAGVTKAGEELAALLPRAAVGTVDAATATVPDAPVLLGTEAVLHRVARAALVAFLDFDAELLAPRLRAGEQALWLLVRAARMAGGRPGGGRVLVQTRLPGHEVVQAAVRGDPSVVADAEAARRRPLRLPPFGATAQLRGADIALAVAAESLRAAGLGVASSGDGLLVRAPTHSQLCDALAAAMAAGRAEGRLTAEVDPLRL